MSQIRASSLTNLRGRAYKCLHCQGPNPCIGEKRRVESHVYKIHIPLERSPFYCKLCTFRCTAQEDLEKHIKNFGPHSAREKEYREQHKDFEFDILEFLLVSPNPYYITATDMHCLSVEESEQVWQERRRQVRSTAAIAGTNSAQLNTPPLIQRQVGTPVRDENIWDLMMGPEQYSSNMTITPSRTGIQTIAPYQLPPVTMAPNSLQIPMYNVPTTLANPALPSLNRGLQTTTSTILSSPVLPSGFHSLFGNINIPSASSLNGPVSQGVPPMTLTQPIVSASVSQTLVNTPPSEMTSVTTSPNVAGAYSPHNPSYTPTPIVKSKVVKVSKAVNNESQTEAVEETCNGNNVANALNDLNKTLHTAITGISKAIENQTLLLGAIHQQIKTFVRSAEDDRKKREREDDEEELRKVKAKKHKKQN